MSIIEFHEGCSGSGGCFGPQKAFITIFGTDQWHLGYHFLMAILLGIALFFVLFYLKRKGKIELPIFLIILLPILAIIILFFLFALLFPVRVLY